MKSGLLLVLTLLFSVLPLRGREAPVVDFTAFPSTSSGAGWKGKVTPSGLVVTFQKYAAGGEERPAVSLPRAQWMPTDWAAFRYLTLQLENLHPTWTPYFDLVFRGGGKSAKRTFRIRGNTGTLCTIKLAELAVELPLKQIEELQIVYPRPGDNLSFRLERLYLSGSAADDPWVPAHIDLLAEMRQYPQAWRFIGEGGMTWQPDGALVLEIRKFVESHPGSDRWPGMRGMPDGEHTLSQGDLSRKTHLLCASEKLGNGESVTIPFSLSLRMGAIEGLYHGLTCRLGKTTEQEFPLYDRNMQIGNVTELLLWSTGPAPVDNRFRLSRLELVFRPETVSGPAFQELAEVRKLPLTPTDRQHLEDWQNRLHALQEQVAGPVARQSTLDAFFALAAEIKTGVAALRRTIAVAGMTASPDGAFRVGVADSMRKVFLQGGPLYLEPQTAIELELAANEAEGVQVVCTGRGKVRLTATALTGPAGCTLSAPVIGLIGHSDTTGHSSGYQCDYEGFQPECVMDGVDQVTLSDADTIPFFLRFQTSPDAKAGDYRGAVTVTGEHGAAVTVPVKLHVFGFALPNGSPIAQAFNYWWDNLKAVYRKASMIEMQRRELHFVEQLATYRILPDFFYLPPDLRLTDFLRQQEQRGAMTNLCIQALTLDRQIRNPNSPVVEQKIAEAKKSLAWWWEWAKRNHFEKYVYIYGFDEAQINPANGRIFEELKRAFPQIPTVTTAGLETLDQPEARWVDVLVTGPTKFQDEPEWIDGWRKRGKKYWWYVCCWGPPSPGANLLLEMPLTSPRLLMGMMAQKYRPDGFLYWEIIQFHQQTPQNPIAVTSPRTTWNPESFSRFCGDGNLFVAGPDSLFASLRLEGIRDGIEDLWVYRLLEQRLARLAAAHRELLPEQQQEAEAALRIPPAVVTDIFHYSYDPAPIRAQRRKVAQLLETLPMP